MTYRLGADLAYPGFISKNPLCSRWETDWQAPPAKRVKTSSAANVSTASNASLAAMLPVLARINPCELAALVGLPFDELIFSVVCGMEIHPTLMTIIRGGANIGLNLTDVVEIDGDLWAVLEWNTHEEPLLKVMLNRRFWEDMEDGTWLYQMPVVWPELGEAAG